MPMTYSLVFVCPQLLTTADEVAKLQEELERMRPLLEEAVQESIVTMDTISKETVSNRKMNWNLSHIIVVLPWYMWHVGICDLIRQFKSKYEQKEFLNDFSYDCIISF